MRRIGAWLVLAVIPSLSGLAQTKTEVPNEVAFRALFAIMRSGPPPQWDLSTKMAWLAPAGFTRAEVLVLQSASTKYWEAVTPLEEQLKSAHARFAGRNNSPEAESAAKPIRDAITAQCQATVLVLLTDLGNSSFDKVNKKLQLMKKEFKAPGTQTQAGHSHPH